MDNPLISVIVPVYNVERYLHQCVQSILKQSYENFELILVDDGSPDGCGAICDEYAGKDKRVKAVHKTNGGLSSARNAGLDIAKGKYILFCDSDDYYLPGAFARLNAKLSEKDYDIIHFGYKKETENRMIDVVPKQYDGPMTNELLLSVAYAGIVRNDYTMDVMAWSKVYKADIIHQYKFRFDETMRIAEDITFNIPYLSVVNTVFCMENALYFYRYNSQSLIHQDKGFSEKGMERSVYFLSKIQHTLESRIPPERLYPIAKNRYNRIVIDACHDNIRVKRSCRERIGFIKQSIEWYGQYLAMYDVQLEDVKLPGKKEKLENYLIAHKRYYLIALYTQVMNLYHRWSR